MKEQLKKLIEQWNFDLDVNKARLSDQNITANYKHRLMGEKKILETHIKDIRGMLFDDVIKDYSDCKCTFESLPNGYVIKVLECDFHKTLNDFE